MKIILLTILSDSILPFSIPLLPLVTCVFLSSFVRWHGQCSWRVNDKEVDTRHASVVWPLFALISFFRLLFDLPCHCLRQINKVTPWFAFQRVAKEFLSWDIEKDRISDHSKLKCVTPTTKYHTQQSKWQRMPTFYFVIFPSAPSLLSLPNRREFSSSITVTRMNIYVCQSPLRELGNRSCWKTVQISTLNSC